MEMTPFARAVRAEIMTQFCRGGAVPTSSSVAEAHGCSVQEVEGAFDELAAAHALVLRPGTSQIWMAHPFSGVPTAHHVQIGDRVWSANCVWDGLAILALLGDGALTTRGGADGAPLRLEVHGGRVRGDGVVHFLVPARAFWADIGFT